MGPDYAAALLGDLGFCAERRAGSPAPHPDLEWAGCGGLALSGEPDGPPRLAPGPLAACARGALAALAALSGSRELEGLDAAALLGERAARLGLVRRGRVSPGGSCRLLPARDAWIAVSLARAEDRELLPAWLGPGEDADPWTRVARGVAGRRAGEVVERARLLGMPAAVAVEPESAAPPWCRIERVGRRLARPAGAQPLVVDLSALWAGPLATQLLRLAGARVIKVESTRRPDGARRGEPGFFDLLNAGKESVALDLGEPSGRVRLRALIARADLVVESARPRALEQLGLPARELLAEHPGLSWLSLTGYGRREPAAGWVAFGDDAGVAAGLAAACGAPGAPLFCGDALADPLTGLHAALAGLSAFRRGGGELLDLALRDGVAHALAFPMASRGRVRRTRAGWEVRAEGAGQALRPPRARRVGLRARGLGADTERVLHELRVPC